MPDETSPKTEPLVSLALFADLVDLSPRRVRTLIQEGKLPPATGDKLPLAAGVRAYVRFLRQGRGDSDELRAERLRLTREQADAQALANAETRRELVAVDEMVRRLSPCLVAMRQTILAAGLSEAARDSLLADLRRCLNDALCGKRPRRRK